MVSSPAPASRSESATPPRWPTILFYVTIVAILAMTWQQAVNGNGDPATRTVAFLVPMAFPLGMAYWGRKTGMSGPALGGLAMAVLFWFALLIGGGE